MDGKNINDHLRRGIQKDMIFLLLGWQQRIVSLMTTGQPLVRSSQSEESRSLEAQW